jgi:hypothetical protein
VLAIIHNDKKKVLKMLDFIFIILMLFLIFKFRNYIWMPTILIILAYAKWKIYDPIIQQYKLWNYKSKKFYPSLEYHLNLNEIDKHK